MTSATRTGNRTLDLLLSLAEGYGKKPSEECQKKSSESVEEKDQDFLEGVGDRLLGSQVDRLEKMADKTVQKAKEELLPDAASRLRTEVDRGLQGFDAILEQRTKAAAGVLQSTLVESADAFETRWTRLLETQFRHEIRLLGWIAGTALAIGSMSIGYATLCHWIGG